MAKPTDRTRPTYTPEQVDELVAASEIATGILPTIDWCRDLDQQLRDAIADHLDLVRQQQAALVDRSRGWYLRDKLITATDEVLQTEMGSGSLSAALHVAGLGRQLRALAHCIRAAG
ncbi:DUF6415 family natural product biosynthesis protein [Streptomyces sp. NBC_00140]|uniref:DUF6415 family natural product biosynthesis protein n=1 Tax=Streptomyces sp. NBC_00140 TaxID=2975664 RepID=UPI00224F0E56|nr:DUF6415 family natural product biosynthesis protein [Streptomyces sp. NBC_00140]MCX5335498.1 FimD/PapC N-terminal domain-containing protein [Streptomyces sp. NBC_00140]MCX5338322.1 FimD/PapC N-terminal domain-containing protein [Streptomyces sp. NBC_00140]